MGPQALRSLPSAERLREVFDYDPATGVLRWKITKGRNAKAGKIAGCSHGVYRRVRVDDDAYPAHRLIWKMVTGHDPNGYIDHVDGNGTNNSWANLREASPGQNRCNSRLNINNTSGFKGVRWCPLHKKWRALVTSEKRTHHVGYFDTPQEAARARATAAERIQGEFHRAA